MKTYILYHANCPDGFGAALVAWLQFREQAQYIPVSYGQAPPSLDPGALVYILDFSYPRAVLRELASQARQIIVLDHHRTAQEDLRGLEFELGPPHVIRFQMEKSGAVMAYQGIVDSACPDEQVPEFYRYLQDRDLWRFELPHSREIAALLRSLPMDFNRWEQVQASFKSCFAEFVLAGAACLDLITAMADMMSAQSRLFRFSPSIQVVRPLFLTETEAPNTDDGIYAVPVANATAFWSEVGDALLERFPEAPFAAYYRDRGDGRREWGLRSRAGFDCSKIAQAYGGGGHAQAAGFTTQAVL